MPSDQAAHSELVERVARAMMDADLGAGAFDGAGWMNADAERNTWRHRARAALAEVAKAAGCNLDAMASYHRSQASTLRTEWDRHGFDADKPHRALAALLGALAEAGR